MPATVMKGHLSSIEEKLSASLGSKKSDSEKLARKLAAQSRSILLQKVEFVPARNESSSYWKEVAQKYSGQKNDMNTGVQKPGILNGLHKKPQKGVLDNDGLPTPKITLFDRNKLQLVWRNGARKGCGLQNTHNTCFMNSVLQALTYTPAFNNYLTSRDHSVKCENRGLCMICVMEDHIRAVSNRQIYTPWPIIKSLRAIAKHFSHGRQEDAHEFLRYFIEAMTKSALLTHSKLDVFSKNTTVLHQIFGGYLRSQVKCLNCDHKSNTFDPMLDLALDIKDVNNLPQALQSFTKQESLHGDNCYSCERCKKKVKAFKRFSIHQAPNILTIQLKRFDMAKLHSKVNKPVNFPPTLNLRPYMSKKDGKPVTYTLYAVLVHSGACASFGHYYTYAKVPNGQWFLFNDSHVSPTSIESVLRQQAYILFYSKQVPETNHVTPQSHLIGPVKKPLSDTNQQFSTIHNGMPGKTNGNAGFSMAKKIPPSATVPKPPTPIPTAANGKPPTPLHSPPDKSQVSSSQPTKISIDRNRQKISFGIKPMAKAEEKGQTAVPLVMKIKDGKVVSNTASPPDTQKHTIFSSTSDKVLDLEVYQEFYQEELPLTTSGVRRQLVPDYAGSTSSSDDEVGAINGNKNGHHHTNGKTTKSGLTNGDDLHFSSNKKDQKDGSTATAAKLLKPRPVVAKINNNNNKKESSPKAPKEPSTAKDSAAKAKETSPVKALFKSSKEPPTKSKEAPSVQFEPILDERLKATTEVPGSYTPLDRVSSGFKTPPFRTLDRKELSLNLSSPEPGKLNSTTKWQIVEQEQKSPSLASSSSSMNSTSDWKIQDKHGRKTSSTQNGGQTASPVGWTVTPVPMAIVKNVHNQSDSPKMSPLLTSSADKQGIEGTDTTTNQPVLIGPQPKPEVNGDISNHGSTSTLTDSLQDSSESSNSSWSKKKKKKEKKSRGEEEAAIGDSALHGEKKKKKKKKKKKHKQEQEREYEPGELPDSPVATKRSHDDDDALVEEMTSQSKKRKEEFEWVERTQDSACQESNNQVPTTYWDKPPSKANQKNAWDGVKSNNSDVLSHLQQSSLQGYGPQVSAWEGGQAKLDAEFEQERQQTHKRSWQDDYEDELGMGKTKKLKKPKYEQGAANDNAFQKYQNFVNHDKQNGYKDNNGYSFGKNDHHGHPYNKHQHNHHGNNQHNRNHHYDGNHRRGSGENYRRDSGDNNHRRDSGGHDNRNYQAFGSGGGGGGGFHGGNKRGGGRGGNQYRQGNRGGFSNNNRQGDGQQGRGGFRGNNGYRGGYGQNKHGGGGSGNRPFTDQYHRNNQQRGKFNRRY